MQTGWDRKAWQRQWVAQRKLAGRCVKCSDAARMGRTTCAACAEKHAERRKRLRATRAAAGQCVTCGSATERNRKMCRACISAAAWKNKLLSYGVTEAQWRAMLRNQGGMCAICGASEPGGKGQWHVDHDHRTGNVRALLCHMCNVGLGAFRDNTDLLRAAMGYLTRHRTARAA